MTNLIEKAEDHSQALYLVGTAPETQEILNALIDHVLVLQDTLDNLVLATEAVVPTEAEFLNETAVIDQDAWDDLEAAAQDARNLLLQ